MESIEILTNKSSIVVKSKNMLQNNTVSCYRRIQSGSSQRKHDINNDSFNNSRESMIVKDINIMIAKF